MSRPLFGSNPTRRARAREGVLGGILGAAALAGDAPREGVGLAVMAVVDRSEGKRVAVGDPRHQLFVGFGGVLGGWGGHEHHCTAFV